MDFIITCKLVLELKVMLFRGVKEMIYAVLSKV